jgi:hypothetical protein
MSRASASPPSGLLQPIRTETATTVKLKKILKIPRPICQIKNAKHPAQI